MLIQIEYSVHHNQDRSYPPEVFRLQTTTPTDKELTQIMTSVLCNSSLHCEWVDAGDMVAQFVYDNRQVLIDWLFGTKELDVTLCADNQVVIDECLALNDLYLFSDTTGWGRNVGLNTPSGHKSDGLWIAVKQIDDQVATAVSKYVSEYTHEQVATMLAIKQFGMLIEHT
jgi:hypothetical protein